MLRVINFIKANLVKIVLFSLSFALVSFFIFLLNCDNYEDIKNISTKDLVMAGIIGTAITTGVGAAKAASGTPGLRLGIGAAAAAMVLVIGNMSETTTKTETTTTITGPNTTVVTEVTRRSVSIFPSAKSEGLPNENLQDNTNIVSSDLPIEQLQDSCNMVDTFITPLLRSQYNDLIYLMNIQVKLTFFLLFALIFYTVISINHSKINSYFTNKWILSFLGNNQKLNNLTIMFLFIVIIIALGSILYCLNFLMAHPLPN